MTPPRDAEAVQARPPTAAPSAAGRTAAGRPPPYLYDPRPDLAADTPAWQALLELAFLLDGEAPDGLFGALHGVRCCGARLVAAGDPGRAGAAYRMAPGDAYLGGAPAWAADRQRWLVPVADVLTPVLRGLRADGVGRAAPGDALPAEPQATGPADSAAARGGRP